MNRVIIMSKALVYAPAVNTARTKLPSTESDPFYFRHITRKSVIMKIITT